MKLRRFLYLIILFVAFSVASLQAQSYRTGVCARVGFFNGLTAKHFVSPHNAVEGILSFRWEGV